MRTNREGKGTSVEEVAGASCRAAIAGSVALAMVLLGGCEAKTNGLLVILQNQRVSKDAASTGPACVPTDDLAAGRSSGRLDIALDKPIPYQVFPLVQNRLASLVSGGVERNNLAVRALHMKIEPPAGSGITFPAECPAEFDQSAAANIDPGQTRAFSANGMESCHTAIIQQAAAAGAISVSETQPVTFTIVMTAVADRGGDTVESDSFRYGVEVCAYCLQVGGNATPACSATPKPNTYKGNGCTPGQDDPGLLCCIDPANGNKVTCPAPDF
jgi:hypothetical protein